MTVRVIEFKKRRVNRVNKSIQKKTFLSRKKEGFFGIKRKSVCFSNKTSSLHTSLTGSLHKVSRSTYSLIPDIFFPFTGFPGEWFREKEKFLFFPSERVVDLFLLPLPLPAEKFLEPDFLSPVFLLAID